MWAILVTCIASIITGDFFLSCQQVVLSPKQLNMTSLQVEILEKEIAELKAALQEAKTKNVYLTGIVEEQKR